MHSTIRQHRNSYGTQNLYIAISVSRFEPYWKPVNWTEEAGPQAKIYKYKKKAWNVLPAKSGPGLLYMFCNISSTIIGISSRGGFTKISHSMWVPIVYGVESMPWWKWKTLFLKIIRLDTISLLQESRFDRMYVFFFTVFHISLQ